jgi:hypothetical protein
MMRTKLIASLLLTIGVISLSGGCGKQILDADNSSRTPVTIQMKISGVNDIQSVGFIQLTVTGPGIDAPIIDTLIKDTTGYLLGEVQVPAGRDRKFVLEVRQYGEVAPGEVLYRGETMADVVPDAEINLNIKLVPVVPMITLSPHYLEVPLLSSFSLDIYVYNVDSMTSLTLSLFNYYGNNFGIDSIVPGKDIGVDIGFHWATVGTTETALYFNWIGNVAANLPKNGHYATVYMSAGRIAGTAYLYASNFIVNDVSNYDIYAGSSEIYFY